MDLNQIVKFIGYNPPLAPGETPRLQEGELVQIYAQAVNNDKSVIPNGWQVRAVVEPSRTESVLQEKEVIAVSDDEAALGLSTLQSSFADVGKSPAVAPVAPTTANESPAPVTLAIPSVPPSVAATAGTDAQMTVATPEAPTLEPAVTGPKRRNVRPTAAGAGAPAVNGATPATAPDAAPPVRRTRGPNKNKVTPPTAEFAAGTEGNSTLPPAPVAPTSRKQAFVDSPVILSLVQNDALGAAKRLQADKAHNDFALGGVLSYVHRNSVHTTLMADDGVTPRYENTTEGFDKYLREELNIEEGYRSIRYKIDAYTFVASLQLPPDKEAEAAALGHTKLSQLERLLGKKGVDTAKALEDCKTKNAREVQDYVRETLVSIGDKSVRETTKKTVFHFSVFADLGENVRRALEEAKKKVTPADGKEVSDSEALVAMATEYLDRANPQEVPLETAVELMEMTYGVKVSTQPDDETAAVQPAV